MKRLELVIIAILIALVLTSCPGTGQDPEPEPVTYALRDTGPAGGLIFYIDEADEFSWDYLEAAPVSTEWTFKEWGSSGSLIGGTGTAIGDGIANTTAIVAWLDTNIDDTNGDVTNKAERAAYLCNTLSVVNGGVTYANWFLPSQDDLDKMYVNLHSGTDENSIIYTPVGGFADLNYWSSSEYNNSSAWVHNFSNGIKSFNSKVNTLWVHAVRAF